MIRELKRPRTFYERLFRLTAPIALQNLITFSLGLIDTFMVSRLSNEAMAAVTTANVPVFLLISIVFGGRWRSWICSATTTTCRCWAHRICG